MPLWVGTNEDDVDGGAWELRRVLVDDDGATVVGLADARALASVARVRGRRVTVKLVSLARHYAPGAQGVEREGPFAIVEAMGRFVVDDLIDVRAAPSSPMPDEVVPAFSTFVRAGCDVASLDRATRALIERAAVRGSFTPDDA